MLEKIKKSFRSASSKNGSYSVGMIVLVICMVIVVNLIAGQLPENVKSIDISDNNIYGVSKTSKKVLNKLDKKVTFKIYAEKDSTDTRIKSFIKKYTALSDKISVKWIDPVLHPAALTKAGVDKNTIVISCKDTGKTKSVSFDDILVSDSYPTIRQEAVLHLNSTEKVSLQVRSIRLQVNRQRRYIIQQDTEKQHFQIL